MSGTSIVEYSTDVSRQTLLGSTLNGPTCTIGVLVLNAPKVVELRTKKFSQFDLPW